MAASQLSRNTDPSEPVIVSLPLPGSARASTGTITPPFWVHAALWLPLICLLTGIFLRLSKSALLVLQYKHQAGEGRLGE